MSGTLSLSSPWCRQEIPTTSERRAIAARIPAGYTVAVAAKSDHRAWYVEVIEHGATMSENRVARARCVHRDLRDGIDAAIWWITDHATATYAGVEVPVR